jgi:hypothetical protein
MNQTSKENHMTNETLITPEEYMAQGEPLEFDTPEDREYWASLLHYVIQGRGDEQDYPSVVRKDGNIFASSDDWDIALAIATGRL